MLAQGRRLLLLVALVRLVNCWIAHQVTVRALWSRNERLGQSLHLLVDLSGRVLKLLRMLGRLMLLAVFKKRGVHYARARLNLVLLSLVYSNR